MKLPYSFSFLVFILEDKYGLSVSSLIRLISCIGYVVKNITFLLDLTSFVKPGVCVALDPGDAGGGYLARSRNGITRKS